MRVSRDQLIAFEAQLAKEQAEADGVPDELHCVHYALYPLLIAIFSILFYWLFLQL